MARTRPAPADAAPPAPLPAWDDIAHVSRYVTDGRAYAVLADGSHVEVDRARPYTGRRRERQPSPLEALVVELDSALAAASVAPELRASLSREAATVRGAYVRR